MASESHDKSSIPDGESPGENPELDHDQVMNAIRQGTLRTIPKNVNYEYEDYLILNKLRKRRRYVKTEISEQQYERLKMYARREGIPIRYFVTRAVEIYLNEYIRYGWGERKILTNITPFDDE